MRNPSFLRPARPWLSTLVLLAGAGVLRADPIQTYVALGDALAFGSSSATPTPSYGVQGYVQQFAGYLGTQNGGVTPNVINLAIPGETSASYFSADNSAAPSRQGGVGANLNYGGDTGLAQRDILAGVIAAENAAGRTITTVSFALGGSDYAALTASTAFTSASMSQKEAMIQQLLTTLQSNYTTALTQIRGALPNAQIFLPSYYDPYTYLGPNNATNQLSSLFVNGQLQMIQSLSSTYHASTVNLTFLSSDALSDTGVASGNTLPTPAGYAAISNQFVAAAEAPEPGTLSLLAFGALGILGRRCLRPRVA